MVAGLRSDIATWRGFAAEAFSAVPEKSTPALMLRGKTLMDAIRARTDGLVVAEERVRAERNRMLNRIVIALFVVLALASVVGIPVLTVWLRRRLRASSTTYEEGFIAAQRRAEELRTTLHSIGDAVLATDHTGTVTFLSAAPAGGLTVRIVSSNTSLVNPPPTVFIPAGSTGTDFPIFTSAASVPTRVTIDTGTDIEGYRAPQVSVVVTPPGAPASAANISAAANACFG